MLLAVAISSNGCTWEVWRALKKLELLSCSPNFSRASITRYKHAKHEPVVNYSIINSTIGKFCSVAFISMVHSFLEAL